MTESYVPLGVLPPSGVLRQVEHPDMSPILTHFCSRSRPLGGEVSPDVRVMSASDRLRSILWEQKLRAFVTYSGGDPAVCLTEATLAGLQFLIRRRGYQPWGLVFERQSVYDAGGGPVWHARPEQYRALGERDLALRSWAVRLDPGSDWLEEREWRIVRSAAVAGQPSAVELGELRIVALIVGDQAWTGALWCEQIAAATGVRAWGNYFPHSLAGVPRWWWNPAAGQLHSLPPFY